MSPWRNWSFSIPIKTVLLRYFYGKPSKMQGQCPISQKIIAVPDGKKD